MLRLALVILGIISIGACYKWGDWKHWKLYYSTLLFYNIGALTENIITSNKSLWLFYGSYSIDRLADYIFGFLIFPCIIIIYLSGFPKGILKQILFMLAFILFMSLVELILYYTRELRYYNGWNIGWSILLYTGVFPLLKLHYRKPLLAMLLLVILTVGGSLYFGIF